MKSWQLLACAFIPAVWIVLLAVTYDPVFGFYRWLGRSESAAEILATETVIMTGASFALVIGIIAFRRTKP